MPVLYTKDKGFPIKNNFHQELLYRFVVVIFSPPFYGGLLPTQHAVNIHFYSDIPIPPRRATSSIGRPCSVSHSFSPHGIGSIRLSLTVARQRSLTVEIFRRPSNSVLSRLNLYRCIYSPRLAQMSQIKPHDWHEYQEEQEQQDIFL